MKNMHEAFLQAIIESPGEDAPRLAYSDWLEDNGDPARAEFIRVQCRLAALDEDDPEVLELQRREYDLLADHGGAWAGPLVGRARRWQFRRGFVEQVRMEAEEFLKDARWLLDFAPIRELMVKHPGLEEIRALVASRHIRRIASLDLGHARLGDERAALLAEAPNLSRLSELSLQFTELGVEGLTALAASTHLRSLQRLDVRANRLPADALEKFVTVCRLPLTSLDWRGATTLQGIRALADSPLAGRLRRLSWHESHLGAEGLRVLAMSNAFTNLEELHISSDTVGAAAIAALAGSALLRRLSSLGLRCVHCEDVAVKLARSTQPSPLRRLDLSFNGVGPDGAKALADSPLCDSLTRLDLSGNPIGDQGVKAIAHSSHLSNVRQLDLYQCGVTRHGVKPLLSSPLLDRLTCLRLDENKIGRKAFDELRARVGERLYHEHFQDGLDADEIIRRVKAEPPRCLRGLGARLDTELVCRFPPRGFDARDFAGIAFELTHPDPNQKAVLLGYEDTRGYDIFFSPYAIRWEPSGQQREFFDAEQHGGSGETGGNCTIVGTGKRTPWKCGRRGCRAHTFIVTFFYRLEYPPVRYPGRHLPFADQFYHFGLDAYCAAQDRLIEIATFECK